MAPPVADEVSRAGAGLSAPAGEGSGGEGSADRARPGTTAMRSKRAAKSRPSPEGRGVWRWLAGCSMARRLRSLLDLGDQRVDVRPALGQGLALLVILGGLADRLPLLEQRLLGQGAIGVVAEDLAVELALHVDGLLPHGA